MSVVDVAYDVDPDAVESSRAAAWPAVEWVPAGAVREWRRLGAALDELAPLAPVCVEDPEAWFAAASSNRGVEAVEWCGACPVRAACLEYAVAADEPWGVWGGTTAAERHAAQRCDAGVLLEVADREDAR